LTMATGRRRTRSGAAKDDSSKGTTVSSRPVPFPGIGDKARIAFVRLEQQWLHGVAQKDRAKVLEERRRRFLSGPLAMPKGEERELSRPGSDLSPRLRLRLDLRRLALASLLDVFWFDPDWWEVTCQRNAQRTLRGGIDWFLPSTRAGSQGIVRDQEWPEVEGLVDNAPPRGKTAALRQFLIRKGVATSSIKKEARKVLEALRQRRRRRA
jgi:hypothetical protein